MGYYEDIYVKRVNRFGTDFKSRIQGEREYAFENYLKSSIYGITFSYKGVTHNGTFEPYKQNETETLHYLLAKREVNLDNGTILQIHNDN